jgi:hypothetical protein
MQPGTRISSARDPAWTTWVGNLPVRAIGAWQRRVARQRGIRAPRTGAITFVQRFGGRVNVHFHLLVPDGVFVDDEGRLSFALHPMPTSADVVAIRRQPACGSTAPSSIARATVPICCFGVMALV